MTSKSKKAQGNKTALRTAKGKKTGAGAAVRRNCPGSKPLKSCFAPLQRTQGWGSLGKGWASPRGRGLVQVQGTGLVTPASQNRASTPERQKAAVLGAPGLPGTPTDAYQPDPAAGDGGGQEKNGREVAERVAEANNERTKYLLE